MDLKSTVVSAPKRYTRVSGQDSTGYVPMSQLQASGVSAPQELSWQQGPKDFGASGKDQGRYERVNKNILDMAERAASPLLIPADFAGVPEESNIRTVLSLPGPGEVGSGMLAIGGLGKLSVESLFGKQAKKLLPNIREYRQEIRTGTIPIYTGGHYGLDPRTTDIKNLNPQKFGAEFTPEGWVDKRNPLREYARLNNSGLTKAGFARDGVSKEEQKFLDDATHDFEDAYSGSLGRLEPTDEEVTSTVFKDFMDSEARREQNDEYFDPEDMEWMTSFSPPYRHAPSVVISTDRGVYTPGRDYIQDAMYPAETMGDAIVKKIMQMDPERAPLELDKYPAGSPMHNLWLRILEDGEMPDEDTVRDYLIGKLR